MYIVLAVNGKSQSKEVIVVQQLAYLFIRQKSEVSQSSDKNKVGMKIFSNLLFGADIKYEKLGYNSYQKIK